MAKEPYISKVCSLNRDDGKCAHGPCREYGWSYEEIERRKALPLVPLRNGLMGKKIGKRRSPEDTGDE